jgi:hypothetical protein
MASTSQPANASTDSRRPPAPRGVRPLSYARGRGSTSPADYLICFVL